MLALLLLLPAFAAAASSADLALSQLRCKSAEVLKTEVFSCDANDAYTDSAKRCLADFERAAGKVGKEYSSITAGEGQGLSQRNTQKDFEAAISLLDKLIETSERLKKEVSAYKAEVVLPDDLGPVESGSVEITEFLRKNPCYHLSQDLLDRTVELFQFKGEELRWTRKIAQAQRARAEGRAENLEQGDSLKSAGGAKASGSGKRTAPAPKAKSSITGVEEDKAKRDK